MTITNITNIALPELAQKFEYEGYPLNPYRFKKEMRESIKQYASLVNKDINL